MSAVRLPPNLRLYVSCARQHKSTYFELMAFCSEKRLRQHTICSCQDTSACVSGIIQKGIIEAVSALNRCHPTMILLLELNVLNFWQVIRLKKSLYEKNTFYAFHSNADPRIDLLWRLHAKFEGSQSILWFAAGNA